MNILPLNGFTFHIFVHALLITHPTLIVYGAFFVIFVLATAFCIRNCLTGSSKSSFSMYRTIQNSIAFRNISKNMRYKITESQFFCLKYRIFLKFSLFRLGQFSYDIIECRVFYAFKFPSCNFFKNVQLHYNYEFK